jgi:signal transduction histidine kinase
MRTLSARILLGFAALTVAFGAITGIVVGNMVRVEEQIHDIRQGHLPLALISKELARREEDLRDYLDKSFQQEPTPYSANLALRGWRDRRNTAFKNLEISLNNLSELGIPPKKGVADDLAAIKKQVETSKPIYEQLLAALRNGEALDASAVTNLVATIRDTERQVSQQTNEIGIAFERAVTGTTETLERSEHKLRYFTILLGAGAIAIAIMISIWVVITLRPLRKLRDAAKRVAAGDYGSRIPEKGPAEVADLAREFNAMARAVEERERELVRSERLAAIGKLSAMITHEIRNPLSAIGLNAELLDDELSDNAEGRALCQAIHHEVDRLTAITEEYLAFGRLPKPKIASEHLNQMVDALASFVREDLAAKHVELALELADTDPIALVDASQLRQCLVNLVRNAAEAVSSKGGGTVTLRTRKAGDRAVIEVEDTGIGIAPEVLPRLFDTFFSTKEGGSGLGLALTQQIVKDHGGDLAVESTVGHGTTFTVSIPRG